MDSYASGVSPLVCMPFLRSTAPTPDIRMRRLACSIFGIRVRSFHSNLTDSAAAALSRQETSDDSHLFNSISWLVTLHGSYTPKAVKCGNADSGQCMIFEKVSVVLCSYLSDLNVRCRYPTDHLRWGLDGKLIGFGCGAEQRIGVSV